MIEFLGVFCIILLAWIACSYAVDKLVRWLKA